MKGSIIVLLAATALAPQVWASKARVNALQNSPTINDERDLLINPARALEHGSFFVIEAGEVKNTTGAIGTTPIGEGLDYVQYSDPKAEGGFSRDLDGEARLGAHIGRHYLATDKRNIMAVRTGATVGYLGVKNPLEIFYAKKMGDGGLGASLSYAKSDEKSTALPTNKQDFLGLNIGYATPIFDVALNAYVTDTAENSTDGKVSASMPMNLSGRFLMDTLFVTGEIDMGAYKHETAAGTATSNLKNTDIRLGLFKKQDLEGGQFFYGGKLSLRESDDSETVADDKTSAKSLNFLTGLEANAASWLDLRGSVSQDVLLSDSKTGAGDTVTGDNNTIVSAGASLKFGKLEVDATLGAALDSANYGKVNGNSLLGDLAMTYSF